MRVEDAQAGADGRAQRHDRGTPDILQTPGHHRIIGGIGQHDEALGDEQFAGIDEFDHIGQQGVLIGDDLHLHPVGAERLPGEFRSDHGITCGAASRGVRQGSDVQAAQQVEDGFPGGGGRVSTHRHRGQFRPGGHQRLLQHRHGGGATGAHDQV